MVLRGDVPVGILHRPDHVQAPRRSLGEGRRAAADAEPGAALLPLALRVPIRRRSRRVLTLDRAVVDLAVEGADLPVVLSGPGLDDLHLRIERERHPRVLERDVPIGLRVVDLRHHDVDAARGERRVALALIRRALRRRGRDRARPCRPGRIRRGPAPGRSAAPPPTDTSGRTPGRRGRRAACSAGSADRSCHRTGRSGCRRTAACPNGSLRPVRPVARLRPLDPGFGVRVEDVDLVQPVVALHVVAAEDVDAPVGQRHARVAVGVVEHALRIAVLLRRPRGSARSPPRRAAPCGTCRGS